MHIEKCFVSLIGGCLKITIHVREVEKSFKVCPFIIRKMMPFRTGFDSLFEFLFLNKTKSKIYIGTG